MKNAVNVEAAILVRKVAAGITITTTNGEILIAGKYATWLAARLLMAAEEGE